MCDVHVCTFEFDFRAVSRTKLHHVNITPTELDRLVVERAKRPSVVTSVNPATKRLTAKICISEKVPTVCLSVRNRFKLRS